MSPYEYLPKIIDNIVALLSIILILMFPYWRLIRKMAISIYDPMFFIIFGDWMGSSLVIFMWMQSDISDLNFYYYSLSQLSLIAGMFFLKSKKTYIRITKENVVRATKFPSLVLVNAFVINFIVTIFIWNIAGIPLFRVSRIGAFSGSGGFGVLERLQSGTLFIATFSACYILGEASSNFKRRIAALYFVWLAIFAVASGSKGSLLVISQIIFVYIFLFKREKLSGELFFGGRKGILIIFIATMFVFLVIAIQSGGDLFEIISSFAFRLISYGDIYIYAYVNDTLKELKGSNPFIGMFGGFLSTFRILPIDMIYTNMGFQLSQIVFPDLDYMSGPNPRHNVFGFHFFGWYGIVYSFFIGCFIVGLQRLLYYQDKPTYIGSLLRFLLYFSLISVISDFDYAMSSLADAIISLLLVFFLSLVIFNSNNYNVRSSA